MMNILNGIKVESYVKIQHQINSNCVLECITRAAQDKIRLY